MSSNKFRTVVRDGLVLAAAIIATSAMTRAANSTTLQGSVSDEDAITRLARPASSGPPVAPLYAQRPMVAPSYRMQKGLVDTTAFNSPLRGHAAADDANLGLAKPSDFNNAKFDLGADRGSKELMVAWEAWHHQLSGAIYSRWSDVASIPGHATLRVTVTRNRQIMPQIIRSSGNPDFDGGLIQAIMSLNMNPGLSFPSKSERQQVSFEADYVAATDIQPGFSWVKNDYEKVRQDY